MVLRPREKIEMTVESLVENIRLGLDQVGNPVAVIEGDGNHETHHVKARSFRRIIINEGKSLGLIHSSKEIERIQDGVWMQQKHLKMNFMFVYAWPQLKVVLS